MASFVVMEPTDVPAGTVEQNARLVRDGFSIVGFLVPPLWLLWHRLFAEAALVFVLMLCLAAGSEALGFGTAGSLLSLLVSIYIGLEGSTLRIAGLTRRGWNQAGVVDAETVEDAEIRYAKAVGGIAEMEREEAAAADRATLRPVPHAPGPVLGLLSYPGH